jgi:hypothetical protein
VSQLGNGSELRPLRGKFVRRRQSGQPSAHGVYKDGQSVPLSVVVQGLKHEPVDAQVPKVSQRDVLRFDDVMNQALDRLRVFDDSVRIIRMIGREHDTQGEWMVGCPT